MFHVIAATDPVAIVIAKSVCSMATVTAIATAAADLAATEPLQQKTHGVPTHDVPSTAHQAVQTPRPAWYTRA